ncbi:MAG: hypothetical protein ACJ760_10915, partial [Thermoleophilaceae bacterium]
PDDQLSLAIGKEGQNARLAARLTGWRVDIRSETEFAAEEADMAYEEDEASGRCAAIMSTGKRCPNAALPGSRYCGLPAHQALEGKDTDHVEEPAPAVAEEPAAAPTDDGEAEVPERAAEEVVEPVASGEPEEAEADTPDPESAPAADAPAEAPAAEAPAAAEPDQPEPATQAPPAGDDAPADSPDPESAPAAAAPAEEQA